MSDSTVVEVVVDLTAPPVYCRIQTDKMLIEGWVWIDSKGSVVIVQPSLKPIREPNATTFAFPFEAIRSITPLPAPNEPVIEQSYIDDEIGAALAYSKSEPRMGVPWRHLWAEEKAGWRAFSRAVLLSSSTQEGYAAFTAEVTRLGKGPRLPWDQLANEVKERWGIAANVVLGNEV